MTVGSFISNNKDEISNLSDCVNKADNDQTEIQRCWDEFQRNVGP